MRQGTWLRRRDALAGSWGLFRPLAWESLSHPTQAWWDRLLSQSKSAAEPQSAPNRLFGLCGAECGIVGVDCSVPAVQQEWAKSSANESPEDSGCATFPRTPAGPEEETNVAVVPLPLQSHPL